MKIYIEEFILQNILINFCLLRLTYLTTKTNTSTIRLIVASLLGSFISIISVNYLNNTLAINILKFISALLIISIAFKQSYKQFLYNTLLLFAYTYALGGAITSIGANNYLTNFGIITISKYNPYIICALVILLTYIFELVSKSLLYKNKQNNYIYGLSITHDKNTIEIQGYLDSGNLLQHNGKPVIILDINCYLKLMNKNLIDYYMTKSKSIETSTINGTNNLKLFTIDKIVIHLDKKNIVLKNQYVAINNSLAFKDKNYQALLSPIII